MSNSHDRQALREYVKQCIILEQHTNSNTLLDAIVNKFPQEYKRALIGGRVSPALDNTRTNRFWKRYNTDRAFSTLTLYSYIYKRNPPHRPDFFVVANEFREYLKDNLKNAEVLILGEKKVMSVSLRDISYALEIAENIEEFIEMVKLSAK